MDFKVLKWLLLLSVAIMQVGCATANVSSDDSPPDLIDPIIIACNAEVHLFSMEDRFRLLGRQIEGNTISALFGTGCAIVVVHFARGDVRSIH